MSKTAFSASAPVVVPCWFSEAKSLGDALFCCWGCSPRSHWENLWCLFWARGVVGFSALLFGVLGISDSGLVSAAFALFGGVTAGYCLLVTLRARRRFHGFRQAAEAARVAAYWKNPWDYPGGAGSFRADRNTLDAICR